MQSRNKKAVQIRLDHLCAQAHLPNGRRPHQRTKLMLLGAASATGHL